VIRRIAKRLPSSADLDQVLASDNEVVGFVQVENKEPINITPAPEEQVAPLSRLKKSIADHQGELIEPPVQEVANVTHA
jgi:hypothetical protein